MGRTCRQMYQFVVKRVLRLGVLLAIVFALSACGGGEGDKLAEARKIPEGQDVTLPAGKYVSDEFKPAVSFTLDKGWQYPKEAFDLLSLEAPEGFSDSFLNFLEVRRVYKVVSSYEAKGQPAPKDLVAWLRNHPRLDTESPKPASVGGVKGVQLDAVASRVPQEFLGTYCDEVCLPLFQPTSDPSSSFSMYEGDKVRFIVLEDLAGKTVVITILAPAVEFEEFLPKAQKVLDTVEWKGA